MKKLLIASCAFLIATASFGQCTPDPQYTSSGIYPDTITNLPHATVGVAFATTITAVIPADTITEFLPGVPLDIDWFRVDQVDGLPTGFTYTCNPANCELPGGASSCLELTSADPLQVDVGTHPIEVIVTAQLQTPIGPVQQVDTIFGYKVVIDPVTGLDGVDAIGFTLSQNVPNPASESTMIRFTDPVREKVGLRIYNAAGELMMHRVINTQRGLNEVEVSTAELPSGLYLYSVSGSSMVLNRRMAVIE